MNLCPACGEPLDDFSPCACVFGVERSQKTTPRSDEKRPAGIGGMRAMVERKLGRRPRTDVVITHKR